MANLQKLAEKLRILDEGAKASEFSKLMWRPKEGKQIVRIVPYKFNPDDQLIALQFYYKLGGNNYLAPCTFGKPDPILETIEALRNSGSNEERAIADKLKPVTRTYTTIIVRGEEDLGVRFWGFGVQVYRQLLKLMTNENWGDITSITDGNDLEVEFHKESKKRNAKGQSFPETIITPIPRKTTVVDPTRRDLMEKVKNQTDILTIFPLKSYDELKAAVEKWLDPTSSQVPAGTPVPQSVSASPASLSVEATPEALSDEFAKFFDSN